MRSLENLRQEVAELKGTLEDSSTDMSGDDSSITQGFVTKAIASIIPRKPRMDLSVLKGFPGLDKDGRSLNFDEFAKIGYGS